MAIIRHASPQAWRRLRKSTSIAERNDIARDIATILGDQSLTGDIAHALSGIPWERHKQA